eukprot:6226417-Amphidinium_carterae.3
MCDFNLATVGTARPSSASRRASATSAGRDQMRHQEFETTQMATLRAFIDDDDDDNDDDSVVAA